jgi:enoyl-CoA hydratase
VSEIDPDTCRAGADEAEPVRLDCDDAGIATVTFDRPGVLNALDFPAMERFAGIVAELHQRCAVDLAAPAAPATQVRVVILTGAGRAAFSSGGDQRALAEHRGEADGARLARTMGDALLALEQLPVPVIAAVNGYALGGGSEIALACDLRVVAEDVRLGLVQAALGLTPGWGAGQRLLRLVGYGRALDMMLSARPYSAAELLDLGVVQHVAPPGEALIAARALATRIAALDPATVRAVKGLLRDGCTLPYEQALAAERARFPGLWAADAHWQAVERFLARKRDG